MSGARGADEIAWREGEAWSLRTMRLEGTTGQKSQHLSGHLQWATKYFKFH